MGPPGPGSFSGILRRMAGGAVGILVLLGALSMVLSPSLAEHFVFFPGRTDPGPAPLLAGVEGKDILLTPPGGPTIHGWWHEAGQGAPAVLLLHGNAGTIAERTPLAQAYLGRGISTFMLDYRGYGRSEGSPSEEGVYEDAETALDFVVARAGSPERVVVHGRSLGGSVAAQVVRRREVAGLILDSTFTSLDQMGRAAYPFLPGFVFRRLRGHFDTLGAVREIRFPLLVIHGTEDRLVPFGMGLDLFESAPGSSEWHPVEGAGHNDLLLVGGEDYFDRLGRFVMRVVGDDPHPDR